jgi:predicted nucleic acid-binding protein
MRLHVLDANALYRFVTDGPGAEVVGEVFKQSHRAGQVVSMSVINWGETLYALARTHGLGEASRMLAKVEPLLQVVNADRVLTVAAARLKVTSGLPYADCFAAVVTGKAGVLVTADPDLKKVGWLRLLPLPRHKQ